ncbi:LOW QUALITY PROTEIN: indian hedgehog protein-like [Scylla paramamosain]|uniref:LOW QUALITY PROTEIN: indian hedgehog protein-like n=1 Tax=Scylla paramamosain TaxID=85552 RepID=UPI003082B94C
MTLGGGCRLLLVTLVFSQALALPHPQPPDVLGLDDDWTEGGRDLDVFLRQTRKHARPMFYINCGYRDLCYCYSKITRHHYCCSCDVGACFPAHARAATPAGTSTPMHHLRTGDQVLAVDSAGSVVASRVLGFLDRRPRETALYLTLRTARGHNLTLSPNHVLFRTAPNASQPVSVFGGDVNVGDVIFSANQTGVEPTEVVAIEYEVMQGAYVPLTKEGTLVVDGTFVSCYASYRHSLAHKFLAPARALPSLLRLRPGYLTRIVTSAQQVVWEILQGILGSEGGVVGQDVLLVEEEGEGEAFLVSVVKQIGRLWYSSEQATPFVMQVRSSAPQDGLLQKLWLPVPLPRVASSLMGLLTRTW